MSGRRKIDDRQPRMGEGAEPVCPYPLIVGASLIPFYEVRLKAARLARRDARRGFQFQKVEIDDLAAVSGLIECQPDIDTIIQLAAQAGVRYSLVDPLAYVDANVRGQV